MGRIPFLWTVQLLILNYGMEVVRKASDVAGPVVWIGMLALAVWMLDRVGWSIDFGARTGAPLSAGAGIGVRRGGFPDGRFHGGPAGQLCRLRAFRAE